MWCIICTLLRRLLQCNVLPRRAQAFGSVSYGVIACQGILAGRARVHGATSALPARLNDELRRPGAAPRALVTLHWTGDTLQAAASLWQAVAEFKAGFRMPGIAAQSDMSGFAASSVKVSKEAVRRPGAAGQRPCK